MTTFIRDTFTGTAGTDLTAHSGETGATWVGHPFTTSYTPHVVIASGGKGIRAASDNYFCFILASGDPGSADYDIVFVLKPRGAYDTRDGGTGVHGGFIGILTKYNASDRTGYETQYTYTDGTHSWQLQKAVAGTTTSLQDVASVLVAGHTYTCTLQVRSTGHRLLVSDNGAAAVEVFNDTDTSVTGHTRAGLSSAFLADDTDGMVMDSYSAATTSTITGVSVSPSTVTLGSSGAQTFTATVSGTDLYSSAVTWSVTGGGSINANTGAYTAPSTGSGTATVTATSVQDNSKSGTATVTYAASGITPASLSRGAVSKSNIKLTWTAASGGVSTLSTHLYRSAGRSTFSDLGLVTGTAYTDTTADPHTVYAYKLTSTDGTSTVDSNLITSSRTFPDALNIGWIGDSNYAAGVNGRSTNIALEAASRLAATFGNRTVTLTNRSIGGTGMSDWQAGSSNLNAAIAALSTAGVNYLVFSHGYNDSYPLDSKATYKANMTGAIAACFSGIATLQRVIIASPIYLWFDPSSAPTGHSNDPDVRNALAVQYNAANAELHNGTTIVYAGDDTFLYSGLHPEWYTIDAKVHINDTGCQAVGRLDGDLVAAAAFGISASPVVQPSATKTITLAIKDGSGNPIADRTGVKWKWFDTADHTSLAAPTDSGSSAAFSGGSLTLTVHTALSTGGLGTIELSTSDGTATQNPAPFMTKRVVAVP